MLRGPVTAESFYVLAGCAKKAPAVPPLNEIISMSRSVSPGRENAPVCWIKLQIFLNIFFN